LLKRHKDGVIRPCFIAVTVVDNIIIICWYENQHFTGDAAAGTVVLLEVKAQKLILIVNVSIEINFGNPIYKIKF
jgi:hypothetical protein